jgi:anti-sigma factor RsiW
MRCPIETQENAELLLSYSARRLDPDRAAILEAHMERCPACREFRDGQRALWEALDEWEARPVSPDFDRRLYRRIEEQERMGWWAHVFGPLRPAFLRPALPLAATACLVLVAGLLTVEPGRIAPPVAVDSPQIREAEQVERALDDLDMLRQFDLGAAAAEDSSRSM